MRRDATRHANEKERRGNDLHGGVTRQRFSGGGTRNDIATRGLSRGFRKPRPFGPSRGARAPQPQHAESGVLLLNPLILHGSVLTECPRGSRARVRAPTRTVPVPRR